MERSDKVEDSLLPDERSVSSAGRELFAFNCAACHGIDARGIDNLGLPLIDSEFVQTRAVGELVDFLAAGRLPGDALSRTDAAMPGFGWMTKDELHAIAEFVGSLTGE